MDKNQQNTIAPESTARTAGEADAHAAALERQDRLRRQMAFCLEIDKEKFIGRQTYLSDGERKENDAEHAWHMAIMTLLLSEYANEEIDVLKTMGMLLIHDLVEIDAGDTYMDHIQPLMLNAATHGKSWEEHGVHLSQILNRNKETSKGSSQLWDYAYENFILPNLAAGKITPDE